MVIEKEKSEKHAFFKNSRECCRFQTGTYIFENLSRNKSMQNCHLALLFLARDSESIEGSSPNRALDSNGRPDRAPEMEDRADNPQDKNDSTDDCSKKEKEEASDQSFADATRREVHDAIFCRLNGTYKSETTAQINLQYITWSRESTRQE